LSNKNWTTSRLAGSDSFTLFSPFIYFNSLVVNSNNHFHNSEPECVQEGDSAHGVSLMRALKDSGESKHEVLCWNHLCTVPPFCESTSSFIAGPRCYPGNSIHCPAVKACAPD
jgi:hypothetical protein